MDVHKNYFGVLIQHPRMNSEKVTKQLGLVPSHAATVDDPVITPAGKRTGRYRKFSSWSYFENFDDEILEDQVLTMLEKLVPHGDFFEKISEENGQLIFIVRSCEDKHAVCSLPPAVLLKLADLRVTLEFEVFKSA